MKLFRLVVHQKNFSGEDLIVNSKDYPEAKIGDILEIHHPPHDDISGKKKNDSDEEYPRLLLQIRTFPDDTTQQNSLQKDSISVEQSIAQAFGLQTYKNVSVKIVEAADVALDSIELTFKDQYMGRSEMWRLKNSLTNTCVYMKKNIEFCTGAVRCQVYEMWAQGDRVACGVITDDTKVVFRSSTSMVYLFLQMSSEMWDFDIYGDLYFEKAVNGFLTDLFLKWKKNASNHEVTIVLFSRTFYEANSLEEFPEHMRECLQKDYKGRFYEDFYRVAVQNERYDDWSGILVQLRRVFLEYLKIVLEYHKRPGVNIPPATNSTAAQGNFLEVLNMSLNVFEKHYLDRSFDRTGQLSVVLTPGVGVFEVDRELTNITKQRIIDNGVGSDLVCVGEQPLHAVPLLKFHNKDTHMNVPDDYSMPHWINLSFYSSNKKIAYSNFIPRIKLPPIPKDTSGNKYPKLQLGNEDECIHNTFFDYDAYDEQIFQLPPKRSVHESNVANLSNLKLRCKRSSGSLLESQEHGKGHRRKMSDPDLKIHRSESNARSEPIAIPPAACSPPIVSPNLDADKEWSSPPVRMVVGSEGSPPFESRALINPFDPSHVTIKLTSNRRRWTHIFPKGPTGVLIQQHHYQAIPTPPNRDDAPSCSNDHSGVGNPMNATTSFQVTNALHEYCKKRPNSYNSTVSTAPPKNPSKSLTYLWGATGEQEWTPALTTGVDWKSLTIPACLPITTDYFPDKRALNIDYVVSLYSLLPESVNLDLTQKCRRTLTTVEVYKELISQRLAQGFQLVVMSDKHDDNPMTNVVRATVVGKTNSENDDCYHLSIGRLFHKISYTKLTRTISVTRYRPRHPYPGFNYQYRYRFHAPHHDTYEESYATFTTEKLEHYNWNYLDNYVCTGGDTEYDLVDSLKFWRFRVYLLPLCNPATKAIIDGAGHCDIYAPPNMNELQQMNEGLLKFIETAINKIKRSTGSASKKARMSLSFVNNVPLVQPRRNSMSNFSQINPPHPTTSRSGSKVMRSVQSTESTEQPINDPDDVAIPPITSGYCLKSNATNQEVVDAMKNPINGLQFITNHPNLPITTFITADAVNWLMNRMEGVTTIEKCLNKFDLMHREGLIRHASGDIKRGFIYGFYLYCIMPEKDENWQFCTDFDNEWLEVAIQNPLNWGSNNEDDNEEEKIPHFLTDEIDPGYAENDSEGPLYKRIRIETDVSAKSDRIEWGHVRYQTTFRPDQAYELVVEWLTSSGSIIAEMLSSWYRKTQTCGLQMIPIPHDPLALPFSNKSDPLRGPIFIPLHVKCLENDGKLFNEFHEDSAAQRLFLLQEAILQRFGFIHCLVDTPNTSNTKEYQYIHSTGTVFVLVTGLTQVRARNVQTDKKYSIKNDVVAPSPHEAYITRHVSGKNKDDYDNSRKMGFLWSWNHMVSRRWRTNQGVDNNFQTKLLKDFKEFCGNTDDRLRLFWEECWAKKADVL